MNKDEALKNFQKQKKTSKMGLSSQYENTENCWQFYNGDQMTYSDQIQFADTWGRRQRAMVNFNSVQAPVDSLVGFMAQNRRQAAFVAHLKDDERQQLYSKNMNAIHDFHRNNTAADQLETDQDLDMVINGYGAIDTDLSYMVGNSTTAPNGEIVKGKLDPLCVYWDPGAKGKNLIDSRWSGYYRDFDLKDAVELFQDDDESNFEQVSDEEPTDLGYQFNPYGGIYDKIKMENVVEWASKDQDRVRVYNHQFMTYQTFYRAGNPLYSVDDPLDAMFIKMKLDMVKSQQADLPGDTMSEDMFEFDPTAEVLNFDAKTKALLKKELGDMIEPVPFVRKVFWTVVVSGDHVFTWFRNICQQGFTIKFKTGTWNSIHKIWQGMVNALIEPAKYRNKALTELIFILAVNSKGGVMVEKGAVDDIADFETKWARTDAVIEVNDGAIQQGRIQEKAKAALPTGLDGLIQLCDSNIQQNGVDPQFLGNTQGNDDSGIKYKRAIKQVISRFARYFDSITLYQEDDARLCGDLYRIWVENNQGTLLRITGPDGADQFIQISTDMLAPEYDVSIQEAPQSMDEKIETGMMLSATADKFLAVGDQVTAKGILVEALQFSRLDGDVLQRLSKLLQPQNQVDPAQFQQMQQQLQQLQQYIQSGQVDKTHSETARNNATAVKTMQEAQGFGPKNTSETLKNIADAAHSEKLAHKADQEVDHLHLDGVHKLIVGPITPERTAKHESPRGN